MNNNFYKSFKRFRLKGIGLLLLICALGVSIASCTRKVARISPNEQMDISGRWNNTDSRLTAEAILHDVLSAPWYRRHIAEKKGSRPVVIVGMITNKTHEHIEAETFIKDIERGFLNSGEVRLVQGGKKRAELRAERADQAQNATVQSMKKFGLEHGADYMLQGSINSIVDAFKKKKVSYYQVNLELTDLQSNEIVWIGEKKIAKYIKN